MVRNYGWYSNNMRGVRAGDLPPELVLICLQPRKALRNLRTNHRNVLFG